MIFFPSSAVKIFPCSYRGIYDIQTEGDEASTKKLSKIFDPEARLTTEYNLTHLPGLAYGKDSYIISSEGNIWKFVINGYYFEINADLTDVGFEKFAIALHTSTFSSSQEDVRTTNRLVPLAVSTTNNHKLTVDKSGNIGLDKAEINGGLTTYKCLAVCAMTNQDDPNPDLSDIPQNIRFCYLNKADTLKNIETSMLNPVNSRIDTLNSKVDDTKSELIGGDTDTTQASTIAGAKKYADEIGVALHAELSFKLPASVYNEYIKDKTLSDEALKDYADTAATGATNQLEEKLNTNITDLGDRISAIENCLDDEESGLIKAVADNKTAIENETSARSTADTALSDRLDVVEDSLGLSGESADTNISSRLTSLEEKLDNVAAVMDFIGVRVVTESTSEKDGVTETSIIVTPENDETFATGDVVIDEAGKEYVYDGTTWHELGYTDGNTAAINELQRAINDINDPDNGLLVQANEYAEEKANAAQAAAEATVVGDDDDTADDNTIKGVKKYAKGLVDALTGGQGEGDEGGDASTIAGLDLRVSNLEATVKGKAESTEGAGDGVVGLVDKVRTLETADTAIRAELATAIGVASVPAEGEPGADNYKEAVEATGIHKVIEEAFQKALQEAKDYTEDQDAVLKGTEDDTEDSVTIVGAKKYAKALVDALTFGGEGEGETDAPGPLAAETVARKDADKALDEKISSLETRIGNVTNVMNFRGAIESFTEIENPVEGDVITFSAEHEDAEGKVLAKAGSEWVYCQTVPADGETPAVFEWIEIGTASASDTAIEALEAIVDGYGAAGDDYATVKAHVAYVSERAEKGITDAKNAQDDVNELDIVINGNADTDGLVTKVDTLVTTVGDANNGLVHDVATNATAIKELAGENGRITALETIVNSGDDQTIRDDVTALQTLTGDSATGNVALSNEVTRVKEAFGYKPAEGEPGEPEYKPASWKLIDDVANVYTKDQIDDNLELYISKEGKLRLFTPKEIGTELPWGRNKEVDLQGFICSYLNKYFTKNAHWTLSLTAGADKNKEVEIYCFAQYETPTAEAFLGDSYKSDLQDYYYWRLNQGEQGEDKYTYCKTGGILDLAGLSTAETHDLVLGLYTCKVEGENGERQFIPLTESPETPEFPEHTYNAEGVCECGEKQLVQDSNSQTDSADPNNE